MNSSATNFDWDGSTSAPPSPLRHTDAVFKSFFERSVDAVWLLDRETGVFVDCNQAAIELIGAKNKQQLLNLRPDELSPPVQPDGSDSAARSAQIIAIIKRRKTHLFEWMMRRLDGRDVPIEAAATAVQMGGRNIHVIISRDISERKQAERELRDMTLALERRVTERTAELSTSEARFRALVEHAPEAIVVYSVETGRFLFGNQHACDLYGVPMSKLAALTPVDVSPEFQPCGKRTSDLAREKVNEVLAGGISVFEWLHRRPDGSLIPTEVRLLRLPAAGQNLIRASIIDNSERKKAERALRESEAKFRALFEGASQGVVLHDENQVLEVNPAAVRILGRQFSHEIIGRHPAFFSPHLQPNGESSDALARKHIEECITTGSARFEWLASDSNGREIPMEVYLTRIEWSGRQVIQAFITDISERKRTAAALAESEARFSSAFRATPVSMSISRLDDGRTVLVNQAFLDWTGYHLEEVLGRDSLELGLWAEPAERGPFWAELREKKFIHGREVLVRNRRGEILTMLLSADIIEIQCVPHLLTVGLDITARKQAEAELRASEARLRESEARFSVAFHASSALIGILRCSDGKYVLVNDAHLNWLGYPRKEVLGRTCLELGMWEDVKERDAVLKDMLETGSVRQRECRWRNRHGERLTVLLSIETIKLNETPHMLSMALDISERKRVEEELRASEARLRESEARFSVAFEASPMFINILRLSDGKYVWANDAFVNRLGYSRDEVLGRPSSEFGMWVEPAEREAAWAAMRTVGSIRQREVRWRDRHGEPFTILLSAEIINFNDAPHILSLALDITQRKRAEVELLKTLEREKELSQLKSNFVSMVSHEFRTPLGIIQSSAELLRDFYQRMQPAEREEQLESVTRNTRRMAGMMEEILVLGRLEAGKLSFQPAPLDLNLFFRRVVDEVLSATSRRCTIELTLDPIAHEAQADERLLGHIFTNLLSNGVKYSEAGAAVNFLVAREQRNVICVIRDQGIGIPADDQQQLFKAFHRGCNVGTRPGTGLGLLLVKRCADLHGGSVQVDSSVGHGTTVTVRLPVFATNHEKNTGH